MAIVKAHYIKQDKRAKSAAKATIRYIENRPGRDGQRTRRALFGQDGVMQRFDAYEMIDGSPKESVLWRFIFSPDPDGEDTARDLDLEEATEKLLTFTFGVRLAKQVQWVAAVHADHVHHRHVHILAIVPERLSRHDFAVLPQILRHEATQAVREQRRELDLTRDLTQERLIGQEKDRQREEGLVRKRERSK